MLLWILIALLTAAAILAVLLPLGREPAAADAAGHLARVYRDQLAELERDKADRRISAAEAESARAEIARRLIAVDGEGHAAPAPSGNFPRRATALAALIGIPVLSLSLYVALGTPSMPGMPLAARLQAPSNDIDTMIAKVESHLAAAPEDGRGWDVIAPVYLRLGRAEDAAQAYRNAIRLVGATAERQAGLGRAITVSQDGIVTAEARAAFEAASALDPAAPEPRYFLGLAAQQEGKPEEAATIWRTLLSEAPADAPWRAMIAEGLAGVEQGGPAPGPSSEDVAAAQDLPEGEQVAMVEGMVGRLAARLKDEPDDVEGWLRLIRSYVVLGRTDAAVEAGQAALAGVADAAERNRVEALLADLGVTPPGAATP